MIKKVLNKVKNKMSTPIHVEVSYSKPSEVLRGKRALVVGGGTGIGKAITNKLLQAGCEVVVASRTIRAATDVLYEEWDVSKIEEIPCKFNEVVEKYGGFDIVVNSQGICPDSNFRQDFFAIQCEDYTRVMRVNADSVYFICQAACNYFIQNGVHGHILNIASTEGMKGAVVPYGISKAAVVSLTEGLGKKMARMGITINGIAPGATATDMMRITNEGDLRKGYLPTERMTLPEEIANVALLMVTDAGKQMPGVVIPVDGGEHLK